MQLDRPRIEFRADPAWLAEVRAAAHRLSLNVSSFIRMTVTQALERQRQAASRISATSQSAELVN